MKIRDILASIKRKKIYLIIALIIGAAGFLIFLRNGEKSETLTVHLGDFLQQVAVSGKVVPTESIDLSFEQAGQIKNVYIKEGNKVKTGQLLASQDVSQLAAQLSEMRAGIDLQKAKLSQLLAGASAEDIKVADNKVVSAQQNLDNAYDDALTVLDSAYNDIYNANNTAFLIQNTYFSSVDQQGIKVLLSRAEIQKIVDSAKIYIDGAKIHNNKEDINSALEKMISDLDTVYSHLAIIRDQCEEGVYYSRILSTDKSSLDTKKNNINSALNDVKNSQQDIKNYDIALQQAKNELALKEAPARQSDVAVFEAQIAQAESQEQNVLAQIRKKQIYSPINGIATKINAKLGSVFSANETAISIISSDALQIESYIPEIYILLVKIGDEAKVTLDAYGTDTAFSAKVVSINPAETIKDGVSTYKTKMQLIENDDRIKSGMTANAIITTDKKSNVISVPQGIIINKDGKKFVKAIEGKSIIEKEVQTGIISSLGNIEVISGLKDGDVVVIR